MTLNMEVQMVSQMGSKWGHMGHTDHLYPRMLIWEVVYHRMPPHMRYI